MLNEHIGYALVLQSLVLIDRAVYVHKRGDHGMHTAGYLGIRQPCEYCRVQSNDAVHMHHVLWEGLDAGRGDGVLWQGARACLTQLS